MKSYRLILFYLIYPILSNATTIDPDSEFDTPQIIRRHGYPAETHTVITADGYLLRLHRIPATKSGQPGGQPVFLQHGILGNSAYWVIAENNSLAFILADAGYDVWLGNSRGNNYSNGHIRYSIESAQYWNFTWHEMGIYDLPAVFNYINNTTNQYGNILYVGHSMGTTMFYVFASQRPQLAENVKFMAALAPIAYTQHVTSSLRHLASYINDLEWLRQHFGFNQLLPCGKFLESLYNACELFRDKKRCDHIFSVISGFDKGFNTALLPNVLRQKDGTSTKTVIHYGQEIKNNGNFQQYDYGPAGNQIEYGTLTPPSYNLENIKVPTYLMFAVRDSLTDPRDVARLAANLPRNIGTYRISLEDFNHDDFLFGKDAVRVVYEPLLKVLRNYTEIN